MANLWGSMNSQQAVDMGLGFLQNTMAMQQQKMQMEQQKQAMQAEQQRIEFLRKIEIAKFKNDSERLKLEKDKALNEQNKLKFLLDQIKAETERTEAQTGQIKEQTKTIEPESKAKIKATEALGTQRETAATKNLSQAQPNDINKRIKEKEASILSTERLKPQAERKKYDPASLRLEALKQIKNEDFYKQRGYFPIKGTGSTEPKGLFGNIGALTKGTFRNPLPAWKSLFTTGSFKGQNNPIMPNTTPILNDSKKIQRDLFIQNLIKKGYSQQDALNTAKQIKDLW